MFDLTKEDQSGKQEKKIKDVSAKFDRIEGLLDNLFAEHGISREELTAFLEDPKHFDHATWTELQKADKQLDQKLQLDLKNIKNNHSTAQKYKTLSRANQWMFVR
ncbi:MAG: hypothetical protein H0U49_06260 [Parachlamydiaceae bacterium]|nr:hypothetical protein [Parachlamydiaceae bacterium]